MFFVAQGGIDGLDCDIGKIETTWIVNSATARNMIPNPFVMTNHRECDGVFCVANGVALLIKGVGDIFMSLHFDIGNID